MTPKPHVVKLGGALLDNSEALACVTASIAAMHRAQSGSVIVVHGGGAAVDRHLARLGMETRRESGIRLTPPDQMAAIASVLGGTVNQQVVGALLSLGVNAVGLDLGDGGMTTSVQLTSLSFDPGRVGRVATGDPRLLFTLLQAGFLPVLSSVGSDAAGDLLNVNADEAAAAIARITSAASLVFLTDVPGVLDPAGNLLPTLDAESIDRLVLDGTIHGGMIPKVQGALATATTTGIPVVIATWRDPTALPRLARGELAGTCILGASVELACTES